MRVYVIEGNAELWLLLKNKYVDLHSEICNSNAFPFILLVIVENIDFCDDSFSFS